MQSDDHLLLKRQWQTMKLLYLSKESDLNSQNVTFSIA